MSAAAADSPQPKLSRKARRVSPERALLHQLESCSKRGDLPEALRLYTAALTAETPLQLPHFNALLYLCTTDPLTGPDLGFRILDEDMPRHSVSPNEASFTSASRLAAAKGDPDLAFSLLHRMVAAGIPPKIRSFAPALLGYCGTGDFLKAREVESHMDAAGVAPDEPGLSALLRVNAGAGQADEVYRILHRMRALVRQVSDSTASVIHEWFLSDYASGVGNKEWDDEKVREGLVKGGGGWHGQGWLGAGRWSTSKTEISSTGMCMRCGEKLACIDIDPAETESFAKSVAELACQREQTSKFLAFKEWLECNGPFDAVIDGANVGLCDQRDFSFFQLDSVVNGIREKSPTKKPPLVILHEHRVRCGPAEKPSNKRLLEHWRRSRALYATPPRSNDDWYWLYAAVSCRSLLVTNDEMRDHLFELLGNNFFPRWKEKHQVRLTFSRNGPVFHMPPPYSAVIQESPEGSWHIPTILVDDTKGPHQWLCATRSASTISYSQAQGVE